MGHVQPQVPVMETMIVQAVRYAKVVLASKVLTVRVPRIARQPQSRRRHLSGALLETDALGDLR